MLSSQLASSELRGKDKYEGERMKKKDDAVTDSIKMKSKLRASRIGKIPKVVKNYQVE